MQDALINPICCVCGELIGSMTANDYLKAIARRGPFLFCPECRKHKCDCCGWFIPSQEMQPNTVNGVFLGNSCETCTVWVVPTTDLFPEDFPHFRTLHQPNLQFINFHELRSQAVQRELGERISQVQAERSKQDDTMAY